MMKAIALAALAVAGALVVTGCATTGYYGYGEYPGYWGYAYPYDYYGPYGYYGYYGPQGYYGPYGHHWYDRDDRHGHWQGDNNHFHRGDFDHHPELRGGPFEHGHLEHVPFGVAIPDTAPLEAAILRVGTSVVDTVRLRTLR